jgi:N-methylhydantoinase B
MDHGMTETSGILRDDPVAFEVIRGGLKQICEEMKSVVMRGAFSPLLSLSADLSCAILDADGHVAAQGEDIPVHLGAMPFTAAAVLETFPLSGWREGDAVLCNDPYKGGTHLPDMTLMAPLVVDGDVLGFTATRVHWPDVGGPVPGSSSVSDHILKEGLRVPPVRLMRGGEWNDAAITILMANMRLPENRFGDLQAQAAGNRRGLARLGEIVGRFGSDKLTETMRATQDHSEAMLREGLATYPQGRFTFVETLDGDGFGGGPYRIQVAVQRRGDGIVVDFAGTSGAARGPINCPVAVAASASYYAVLASLGNGAEPNSGAWRLIEVITPAGSLVSAASPVPVVAANTETSNRIVDVVLGALAQAGTFGVAGSYGSAAVYTLGGTDPASGRQFVHYETVGGGMGAGPGWPGTDGMRVHMGNTMNLPIEAMEASMPVRFIRYELVDGSGGDGRFIGGLGVRKRFLSLADNLDASVLLERCVAPAPGRDGGAEGKVAGVTVYRRDGHEEKLDSKSRVVLQVGDGLEVVTAGGGGWGQSEGVPE